ncbi:MAG TPA: hypothetical protein ENK55_08450 [Actinobacteria bacterium]|nr:hypothetical protein [Actinomycetota bacterium]
MTTRPGTAETPDALVAEVSRDGRVTHGEMERVLLAAVACVRAAGYEAELDEFRPRTGWSIGVMGDDPATAEAADVELDRCEARFVGPVADAYFAEHGLSDSERELWDRTFVDCLRRRGNEVEDRPIPELFTDPSVVGIGDCSEAADAFVASG